MCVFIRKVCYKGLLHGLIALYYNQDWITTNDNKQECEWIVKKLIDGIELGLILEAFLLRYQVTC